MHFSQKSCPNSWRWAYTLPVDGMDGLSFGHAGQNSSNAMILRAAKTRLRNAKYHALSVGAANVAVVWAVDTNRARNIG